MLKQLNNLKTIDTLSWFSGAEVKHPTGVQEVPGSIPGSGKDFYVRFFVSLLLCFYVFVHNTFFWNRNLYFLLQCKFIWYTKYILPKFWPIIKVSRYRPSIFMRLHCDLIFLTVIYWLPNEHCNGIMDSSTTVNHDHL